MKYSINNNSNILKFEGNEVRDFLNRLITNDINKITEDNIIFSGLLSPQGKILFEFFIYQKGQDIFLEVAENSSGELVKKLNLYKLRSDVRITDVSDEYAIIHIFDDKNILSDKLSDEFMLDPRLNKLGYRKLTSLDEQEKILTELSEDNNFKKVEHSYYLAFQYKLGIFEVGLNYIENKYYPFDFYWDKLNAMSFTKGCYVGQEVISRLHHKTEVRKRALYFNIVGSVDLAEFDIEKIKNTQIHQSDMKVGEVIDLRHHDEIGGIALINIQKSDINSGDDFILNEENQYSIKIYDPLSNE